MGYIFFYFNDSSYSFFIEELNYKTKSNFISLREMKKQMKLVSETKKEKIKKYYINRIFTWLCLVSEVILFSIIMFLKNNQ